MLRWLGNVTETDMSPIASSLSFAEPKTLGFLPDRVARLQSVLQDEINCERVPGAVVMIARHGKIALLQTVTTTVHDKNVVDVG